MIPFRPAFGTVMFVMLGLPISTVRGQDMEQQFLQGLSAYQQADGLQAGEFWEPCARGGHADCQYALGVLFDDGAADWPSDRAKALQWLIRAARQGHVVAQIRLGFLYAIGRDTVKQDIEEAYIWFSLAASAGSQAARVHRAKVLELMTEVELERANHRILERGIRYKMLPPPSHGQGETNSAPATDGERE